jgi:formylglycine-generating enzyme required for sulfatase activity
MLDLTEVSNGAYERFVKQTGARPPSHWVGGEPSVEQRPLPVVGVTAAEATKYADWSGKRLPTEAEWERAARGIEGSRYPWGDQFDRARCTSRGSAVWRLVSVKSLPGGRSLTGVYHMAGNAAEWTADAVDDPLRGSGRIVRGGSVKSHPTACTTYASYAVDPETSDPELYIGFRCAKDVE